MFFIFGKFLQFIGLTPILVFALTTLFSFSDHLFASSEEDLNDLKSQLKSINSMTALFQQRVENGSGVSIQKSSGKVTLKKPRLFRWEVIEPDKNLVVSDGKKVWNYDEALEQVTVRPLKESEGSPVFFLSGEVSDLDKDFKVKRLTGVAFKCSEKTELCYELESIKEEPPFQWVRIGFSKNTIKELQMLDQLGQVSFFDFSSVSVNPIISPNEFRFDPPKGVDVLGP